MGAPNPKPLGYLKDWPKVWPFPTYKGLPYKPAKVRVRVTPNSKPPKPRYTDEAPF